MFLLQDHCKIHNCCPFTDVFRIKRAFVPSPSQILQRVFVFHVGLVKNTKMLVRSQFIGFFYGCYTVNVGVIPNMAD